MTVAKGDKFHPSLTSDSMNIINQYSEDNRTRFDLEHIKTTGVHRFKSDGGLEYSSGVKVKLQTNSPRATLSASGLSCEPWMFDAYIGAATDCDYSTIALALAAGKKHLLLAPETHAVSSIIDLTGNDFTIKGVNPFTSIVNIAAANYYLDCGDDTFLSNFKLTGAPTSRAVRLHEVSNFYMDTVWLETTDGNGLDFSGTTSSYNKFHVINSRFKTATAHRGISIVGNQGYGSIIDSKFFDSAYGVYASIEGADHWTVHNCYFDNMLYNAIYANLGDYWTIDDSTIKNCGAAGLYIDGATGNGYASLTNNNIYDNTGYGIHMDGIKASITGNNIIDNGDDGVWLTAASDRCVVAGNVIYNNTNEQIDNDGTNNVITPNILT